MLMFGLRLGSHPQAIVTTTPKPYRLLKDIMRRPSTHVTKGATFENEANLSPVALEEMRIRYEGTALGRQELYGELIEDIDGAMWQRSSIEDSRKSKPSDLDRVVVAVDPAVSSAATSDETGIIVAGAYEDHAYVIDDRSLRGTPELWAEAAIKAYTHYEADVLVYEKNQGGELVASALRAAAEAAGVPLSRLNLHPVVASRGKRTRAEPIAIAYTPQGGRRVHHVRSFPELEDQMCTWVPGEPSPDRMDALVWALTYLLDRIRPTRRKLRFAP